MSEFPTSADPLREKVIQLATACLAQVASPEELARLDQLLSENPAARKIYLSFMADSNTLRSWALRESGAEITNDTPEPGPSDSSTSLLKMSYWRKHRVRFGGLALVLTLVFWAGFFVVVMQSDDNEGPQSDPFGLPASVLATVTDARGVGWQEDASHYVVGDSLTADDVLELSGGLMEVTFVDGAVVLLQGPARFSAETRGAGTLEHGRLVARIEKQAGRSEVIPFAISTPLAQVIDLGTEFGVEAESDGTTQIDVFQGRVEATPQGEAKTPRSRPLLLVQGQSARIAAGDTAFQRSDRSFSPFVQEMPPESTQVITPVAAETSLAGSQPESCIDGSGLKQNGSIDQWTHEHNAPGEGLSSWMNNVLNLPATLTFDLGGEYELSSIWLWNYSHPNEDYRHRSVRNVRVEISSVGDTFIDVGNLELAAFENDPTLGQRFTFNHRARYVRITVLDSYTVLNSDLNPGDHSPELAEVHLGEVRFEGTPAAAGAP